VAAGKKAREYLEQAIYYATFTLWDLQLAKTREAAQSTGDALQSIILVIGVLALCVAGLTAVAVAAGAS
jgi:hypothetical protein